MNHQDDSPRLRSRGPTTGDALGLMLLECLGTDGPVVEVYERDDGHVDVADARRYFAPPERWSACDRWSMERITGSVVDVGAGAGRHALALQAQGHSVVAVDVSAGAIEVMRRQGVVSTFHGSLLTLARQRRERFDVALLLGNNLALFGSPDGAQQWLRALDRVLAPGGRVLATCIDPYRTDDPDHLRYHARNRALGRMAGQNRIRTRFGTVATPWFDCLFLSLTELEALLAASSWRITDALDDGGTYAVELVRR